MENNLYYTPTLKDLHYGFEFEYKSKDDNWIKVTLDTWNSPSKENHLKYFTEHDLLRTLNHQDMACKYADLTCIRVKYLDQSDIESLGWESDQYVPERNICLNFKKPNDWYLNYWFGQIPYIEISRDGYDTGCALNVKNKSELIKLMQQLNIK